MVIYEVNLDVSPEVADDYVAWLRGHVRDVRKVPGVLGADLFSVDGVDGWPSLSVRYRIVDKAALQNYLDRHAPRLQIEGIQRFGDKFRATRRVLTHVQRF